MTCTATEAPQLPHLAGSEKQVRWANEIRTKSMEAWAAALVTAEAHDVKFRSAIKVARVMKHLMEILPSIVTDAGDWINSSEKNVASLRMLHYVAWARYKALPQYLFEIPALSDEPNLHRNQKNIFATIDAATYGRLSIG